MWQCKYEAVAMTAVPSDTMADLLASFYGVPEGVEEEKTLLNSRAFDSHAFLNKVMEQGLR